MRKITIYTDGGARGNPGPAGAGVVFCNEKGEIFKKYSEYLGDDLTNNEAEYMAAILALKKFKQLLGKKVSKVSRVTLKSDSELLVKQMNKEYKIKEPDIQSLFLELWNLTLDFEEVKFKQVPREKNKEADSLVNEAIDEKLSKKKLF
ncbi:MAG: reverse transcriptase-like protein [Candidatus Nealsonbacteria bacterium]|nr:reverse transcriptase-like protein [Candidatus Nealsonbacteria bacterium]